MAFAAPNNSHSGYCTDPFYSTLGSKMKAYIAGLLTGILVMSILVEKKFIPKDLVKSGKTLYLDGKRLEIKEINGIR